MAQHILTATLAIAALALSSTVEAQGLKYADFVSATFEKEDAPSAEHGVKKCEVSITMNANAKAEWVDLRVLSLTDGRGILNGLTVDVVEYTISRTLLLSPENKRDQEPAAGGE